MPAPFDMLTGGRIISVRRHAHAIAYMTRIFQTLLGFLLVAVASSCSTISTEPQAVREMRPRLAQLHRGMSDEQMRQTLQLSPFTFGFGCLHQWHYVCDLTPDAKLTISMLRRGTNGMVLEQATLRVFGRTEETWPR